MAEETNFSHSSMLFTSGDGNAMKFRIRPSFTRSRLLKPIEHGGGIVTSKSSEDCIPVLAEGDKHFSDDSTIEARYIDECIAQNRQLDIELYRVKKNRANNKTGDTGRPPSPSTSIISTTGSVKGRSKYTTKEDEAILKYIAANPTSYRGNAVWKKMETLQITSHPWQSMRDRFGKKLEQQLGGYITKYKTRVLEKYGMKTSSDSSAEGIGKDDKPGESSNTPVTSENENNNHNLEEPEQDIGSNDSFDESLLESAHGKGKPQGSKSPQKSDKRKSPRKTNRPKQNDLLVDDDVTDEQDKLGQSSNEPSQKPKKVQSSRVTRSHQVEEVQSPRVTRSHGIEQPLASDITPKKTENKKVSKRHGKDEAESENSPYTKAKRMCQTSDRHRDNSSSHDAEGEDTGDDAMPSKGKRKTKMRRIREIEPSSSDELEETSHDQSVSKATIDDMIRKRCGGSKENGETKDDVINESDNEETQITGIKDSLGDSQETTSECEECHTDDVRAIQRLLSEFGLSTKAALYAVYINSGDIDATYHYIRTGQPPDGRCVWEKADDDLINSTKPRDIRQLVKKFGQEEVTARQRFFLD